MPRHRPAIALLAAALVLVCGSACGGADDRGPSGEINVGDQFSVTTALGSIPTASLRKPDGSLQVMVADLDAATAYGTAPRPDSAQDAKAVQRWLGPLDGGPGTGTVPLFVPLPAAVFPSAPSAQVHDELGWSVVDVSAFVSVEAPPDRFAVVLGDGLADHLSPELAKVEDGIVSAGTGKDFTLSPKDRTAARPLGRPLRMAAQGHDRVAESFSTPAVRTWLGRPYPSLLDDDSLKATAEALDAASVVSAVLVHGNGGSYDAAGIGWAVKDDAALITVAFHYADADTAAAQVTPVRDAFTGPGTSGAPLDQVVHVQQVTSDDAIVVATLTVPDGSRPGAVYQMLAAQDGPFGG